METYTAKIAKNSLWATTSFVFATVCNFAMSIIITRYFGKELYGQYSYFVWLSGVLAILAGFGLQQTLTKFIPKYFFAQNEVSARQKTAQIFRKLITVQIIGSTIISALCITAAQYFEKLIQFDQPHKAVLLMLIFLSVIPVSLNNFLSSTLTTIQAFKKLARTHIFTSILNLIAIVILVINNENIVNFLWIYLFLNILSSGILLFQAREINKKTAGTATVTDKLFSYSAYSYISTISTQIVWERSELFFLGMFSDSSQIAIYTLAYSLAVLFIGVWGPLNGVLNATFSEVVLTNKQDKLQAITQHGTKYLAILILPISLLASLFMSDVIGFVYGKTFQDVAILFPFLVIAHAIAVIITPAGSIPMLKQEIKKTMFFNIATATVNIALDIYLIAKYQAAGAMLANVISQFFSIALSLINAKKYKLGIFNKYMMRVFSINALMAIIFFTIAPYNLLTRVIVALIAAASYIFIILKTAFNRQDIEIMKKLFHPLLHWCIKKVEVKE